MRHNREAEESSSARNCASDNTPCPYLRFAVTVATGTRSKQQPQNEFFQAKSQEREEDGIGFRWVLDDDTGIGVTEGLLMREPGERG